MITPTPDLRWYPCFDGLECARLQVPLDWTSPSDPRTVAIAMTKIPASVPESSPEWDGPVLLNPGGPGGSGVEFALTMGKRIQSIVGATHSVIGFDPRGINNTTPATSCFPDDSARSVWALRSGGRVAGYSSDGFDLAVEYARAASLGAVCGNRIEAGSGADFDGTPNVARDMLAIVEASWNRLGVDGSKKGLRYWGFSYGTALGQTFATMYPDRVERLVLDGVVDMDDYYIGGWRTNLQDADGVIESFFTYCAKTSACPLHAETLSAIKSRVTRLLEATQEPVPVLGDKAPDWISDADIRTLFFWSLYNPIQRFPLAAAALAALEAGDAAKVADLIHPPFSCECALDLRPNTGSEADFNILCQDGAGNDATLTQFAEYVKELQQQSALIGGNWAKIQMACTGYHSPARGLLPWRDGNLTGWNQQPWGANTSVPILFVSTKLDPVTPLRNAQKMKERFEGAGLLVQDNPGHCSLSAPSACVARVIGRYFAEGTVGVGECAADAEPWGVQVEAAEATWNPRIPGGVW
ncbi:Alpha/Beta hydrolase protein [Sphaerosporella brunnea]|uniref:Alpha/Beta hydrolase protein n=1 Tax=Sphaerosporella brunnea TaxID=1250544 RepID=A0A5J5F5R2_9PEZI|nr:Alpha/Beta hydrolase protein [Sphaerosporella brunnea]